MTPQEETLSNLEKSLPSDPQARFFKLSEVAAAAYDAGDYDKAETYANELLSDADRYRTNWNYGNAIFHGNMILGLVALKRDNNVSQAESYLLAAGRTPGSPQLDQFWTEHESRQRSVGCRRARYGPGFSRRMRKILEGGLAAS